MTKEIHLRIVTMLKSKDKEMRDLGVTTFCGEKRNYNDYVSIRRLFIDFLTDEDISMFRKMFLSVDKSTYYRCKNKSVFASAMLGKKRNRKYGLQRQSFKSSNFR